MVSKKRSIEDILVNSEGYVFKKSKLPPEGVISAKNIKNYTVEPLDEAVTGNSTYKVSLCPSFGGKKIRIRLHEFRGQYSCIKACVDVQRPNWKYDAAWLHDSATAMIDAYREPRARKGSLPSYGTLRQLIATRVEYYLMGGSAQRHDN